VLTGETVVLQFTAKDMEGNPVQGENVTWSLSYNGVTYTALSGHQFQAPETPCRMYVKAEAASAPGVIQEAIFHLDAVTEYTFFPIRFGEQDGKNPCMGETYRVHENGRYYGFTDDHTDRIRTFRVFVPRKGFKKTGAIQLTKDSVFEYGSGNGIFLVRTTIDTEKQYGMHHRKSRCHHNKQHITIEENTIIIPDRYPGWVKTYERVVTVQDGRLTLAGGEDLLLIHLEVKELTPEEAAGYKDKPPCTWPPHCGRPDDWPQHDGKGGVE
jgi:hypothetical protein